MPRILNNEISRVLALLSIAVGSVSCAGADRREEKIQDILPTLPMAVFVDIDLPKDETTYGEKEQWQDVIVQVFEDLHVSQKLTFESVGDSDLKVKVTIKPGDVDTNIRADGAFLGVLAWITIPLLPLWLDDVDVHPGLHVNCSLFRRVDGSYVNESGESKIEYDEIATCMLDRYPFLSWSTLSVLLVPPFVHTNGNPEHLESSIGPSVRHKVAVEIAKLVKASGADNAIRVRALKPTAAGWTLSGTARPHIGLLRLSVDYGAEVEEPLDPDRGIDKPFELEIRRDEVGSGDYLRIETLDSSDGSRRPYTLRLPRPPHQLSSTTKAK